MDVNRIWLWADSPSRCLQPELQVQKIVYGRKVVYKGNDLFSALRLARVQYDYVSSFFCLLVCLSDFVSTCLRSCVSMCDPMYLHVYIHVYTCLYTCVHKSIPVSMHA